MSRSVSDIEAQIVATEAFLASLKRELASHPDNTIKSTTPVVVAPTPAVVARPLAVSVEYERKPDFLRVIPSPHGGDMYEPVSWKYVPVRRW